MNNNARSVILVVDDDPNAIQTTNQTLGSIVAPLFALSGPEALDLVKSARRPDLILRDVTMPRANPGPWKPARSISFPNPSIPKSFGSESHRKFCSASGNRPWSS